MTAQIVIDDGTAGPVTGSTDEVNDRVGDVHTISNFDDTGVLGRDWLLLDRPIGSASSLSSLINPTTLITPDTAGSYLLQLTTYLDVPKTIIDGVDTQVIGIRLPTPYDWLIPAAGETIQQSLTRGWAEAREQAIRAIAANLWPLPTTVKVGAHTATAGDLVFYDPTGGTFQINAPASPVLGQRFAIKNVTVDATNVTISGNGSDIQNPATTTLVASFGLAGSLASVDYIYDGTNWLIL